MNEVNQNTHVDLEMMKAFPEEDVDRSVSVMQKVAKFFAQQADIKQKLFDKELIKTVPSHVFKSLVQSQATRNMVVAELKKMPICQNFSKEDLDTTLRFSTK